MYGGCGGPSSRILVGCAFQTDGDFRAALHGRMGRPSHEVEDINELARSTMHVSGGSVHMGQW